MNILEFARKHLSKFSLKPADIRKELKELNDKFEDQFPNVKPEFKRTLNGRKYVTKAEKEKRKDEVLKCNFSNASYCPMCDSHKCHCGGC